MKIGYFLPTPRHFEQASQLVTEAMIAAQTTSGPDVERHVQAPEEHADTGFDELYIQQIGPEQDSFFEAHAQHVLPRVG
ncbi:MAG TPA: hypothetical protein VMA77_24340 [Solirubrobacteraceae bacterium]|nr:hypothetical protein [Solirubrobacteraceae bacterium]